LYSYLLSSYSSKHPFEVLLHDFIGTLKIYENKNILFEPFKSTKTKGNGLGLALSKEIIEKHNGKISLFDKEKGFIIKLPIQ